MIFNFTKRENFYASSYKNNHVFYSSRNIKDIILKIGEREVNYYKIYDDLY
jgi:hypothetical protein